MPELTKKKSTSFKDVLPWLVVLVLTPATIAIGGMIGKRSYLVVSILVLIYAMVPFFMQFERRRPQARELVTLAVMIAIAVASRAAFAFVPNFKPIAAIVMITGVAFGASSGFLCGALAMLVSNFIFGQGPWTMFQMFSYGIGGFIFGFLADRGIIKRGGWSMAHRAAVSLGGGVLFVVVMGPILDTSSLFWMLSSITPASALAVYASGLPVNIMQGIATFITLFLIGNAILEKLDRIKVKYGMMQ